MRTTLTALLLLLSSAVAARADGDHDRARDAVRRGEILPIERIMEAVAADTPGQVLEVELEQRGRHWIYEVEVLRADGVLVEREVDAADGTVRPKTMKD